MSTLSDVWRAWSAAVQAGTVNQAAATDILQTFTDGISNAEGNDWFVAVATEYNRIGLINNPTYGNLRNHVSGNEAPGNELFDALAVSIQALPESTMIATGIRLQDLRADRDEVVTSQQTIRGFKTGQTRQVRDALERAADELQLLKERIRDEIKRITGDPDS